ncbi:MAG: hypothetical protein KTR25_16275 [Myxococcales bacterium]|nr:hypothetical protein [Myxococcales bacterium]
MCTLPTPIEASETTGPANKISFRRGFPVTRPDQLFPLEHVKRGMTGVGYTVFEEDRPAPFGVEVLGVMENMLGPGEDVILAKLTGEKIAFTGVIAGMSGSPVFMDGRLVGAVAYRFGTFTKEPIAGITPIQRMLPLLKMRMQRTARSKVELPSGWASVRGRFVAKSPFTLSSVPNVSFPKPWSHTPLGDQRANPIATPISASGLHPLALHRFTDKLPAGRYVPNAGGKLSVGTVKAAPMLPGAPIAVMLTRGDVQLSAIGTITYVHDGEILAFGHPFVGQGPTAFPMARAAILNTLTSEAGSYKQGLAGPEVGAIMQDRLTAISGRLQDSRVPMVPMRISLTGPRNQHQQFLVEMVHDEAWMPTLADTVLNSAIVQRIAAETGGTVHMVANFTIGERRHLRVEESYAAAAPSQVAMFASQDVGQILRILGTNALREVKVHAIDIDVELIPEIRRWSLISAHLRHAQVARGNQLVVEVHLRSYRGDNTRRELRLEIPRDAPLGPCKILVGDGASLDKYDAKIDGGREPQNLDELMGILAERRSAHKLYARSYFSQHGLRLGAELYPALPASSRAILGARTGVSSTKMTKQPGPQTTLHLPGVLRGSMSLEAHVVPSSSESLGSNYDR